MAKVPTTSLEMHEHNKIVLFARLAKVDEAKREVWGVATAEMVDKEGEIFDYESSKPYFKNWSDEIAKATDGKSLGNVREMHEPSAVGKLVDLTFDDDLKQIQVGAKIVDDTAWKKCAEGVYTGFSIGGAYVKAWKDGEYVRFTAKPAEISVVDNPCVSEAHFTAVKADGTIELRKFAPRGGEQRTPLDKNAVEPIKKDLGTVSNLAYILQSACYIQMDAAYEAEYEADGSALPAELAAWVKEGAAILQRMTEEELNEMVGTMKSTQDRLHKEGHQVIGIFSLDKKGAKYSAKTKEHLAGIQKCMDSAQDHLDALGKDDGVADSATAHITKSSAATPQIEKGEAEMLDPKEKELLDKAVADSAEVKTQLGELATAVNNLVRFLAGEPPAGQKVARTVVPQTVTVTKTQEAEITVIPELTEDQLAKLTPSERERRYHAQAAEAFKNPRKVTHTPKSSVL